MTGRDLVAAVGLVSVIVGIALISVPAALIGGGAGMVAMAVASERRERR
jgi:hypothetical protein